MFGFLNINKIGGVTSRAVVNQVSKLVRRKIKVGHAGTLDPLATGVLVLGVGPATRLTKYVQAAKKTYLAEFTLGVESESEDTEAEVTEVGGLESVTEEAIVAVLPEFTGSIEQLPPKFSALKVNGKRAYDLARKGKSFELQPRKIVIDSLSLKRFELPLMELEITCGAGTYVRSLGRDIARRLGTGAVMSNLCRTAIGCFKVEDALCSNDIAWETIKSKLVPPQNGIGDVGLIDVPADSLERFFVGEVWNPESPIDSQEVGAVDPSGKLLAILNRKSADRYTPKTNFTQYWKQLLEKEK